MILYLLLSLWLKIRGVVSDRDVSIIYNNGCWLSIKVRYEIKEHVYSIEFRDSYRMFPLSLSNLAKSFDIESKIEFDHKKVTDTNYFTFKEEIVKYIIRDVNIIYKVLDKLQDITFSNFVGN